MSAYSVCDIAADFCAREHAGEVTSHAGGCYESQTQSAVFLDRKCDAQSHGGGVLAAEAGQGFRGRGEHGGEIAGSESAGTRSDAGGRRGYVHWNLPDPASEDGPPERKRAMFRRVRDEIARRVDEFAQELAPRLKGVA
jgi:protein-tyrosine-phosphatase